MAYIFGQKQATKMGLSLLHSPLTATSISFLVHLVPSVVLRDNELLYPFTLPLMSYSFHLSDRLAGPCKRLSVNRMAAGSSHGFFLSPTFQTCFVQSS